MGLDCNNNTVKMIFVIILIIIIFYIYSNHRDNFFDASGSTSTEAINNLASMYNKDLIIASKIQATTSLDTPSIKTTSLDTPRIISEGPIWINSYMRVEKGLVSIPKLFIDDLHVTRINGKTV